MKKTTLAIIISLIAVISATTVKVAYARTESERTSFKNYVNSYNTVIKYLQTVIKENPTESYICLGVDGSAKEDITLSNATKNGEILNISEEVADALAIIKNAYSSLGYEFDAIRIKDSCIAFDSIDGRYSLVYAEGGIENVKKIYGQDSNIEVRKLQGNWYHKFA